MKKYLSKSAAETKAIGAKLAKEKSLGVIALSGELGIGKTTFVQGFAKGLGIKEKIISPTFVLIRQHKIPKRNQILYHIDLYRLENDSQIKSLGLEEIINNPNNLVLIEWGEKMNKFFYQEIEQYLPNKPLDFFSSKNKTIKIFMKKTGDNSRLITIE